VKILLIDNTEFLNIVFNKQLKIKFDNVIVKDDNDAIELIEKDKNLVDKEIAIIILNQHDFERSKDFWRFVGKNEREYLWYFMQNGIHGSLYLASLFNDVQGCEFTMNVETYIQKILTDSNKRNLELINQIQGKSGYRKYLFAKL
jgi:hypothetical protein